jgi:hypothetical protein
MGKSRSWIVVESADAAAIAAAIGVSRSASAATRRRGSLAGRLLEGNRYLLVAESSDHPAFARRRLAALARVAPLTFCSIDEHVMWSSAQRWERGRELWSASHRGEESPFDLRTTGDPPAEFAAAARAAKARQDLEGGATAGVDLLFDVPIELAHRRTGIAVDDAVFDLDGFERLDGDWRHRWHALPLLAKLGVAIAALYALAYLAGVAVRAL